MEQPLVSIIIPTYNRAHLIGETLDSILAQSYTHWECIVVDDGSTDATEALLQKYMAKDSRIRYYHRPPNRPKGANACRNYGFELSKGAYVLFLDSDDILKGYCLALRMEFLIKDCSIGCVVADTAAFCTLDRLQSKPMASYSGEFTAENTLRLFLSYKLPWVSTLSVLWRKSILKQVKFDEKLLRFQDIDFHINVLRTTGCKIYKINKIDNYYRVGHDVNKKSTKFVSQVLKSFVYLDKKYCVLLSSPKHIKMFRKFNMKVISGFLINHYRQNKQVSNKTLIYVLKSKTVLFSQKVDILFLLVFLNTGLFFKKGIGMYRFHSYLKRQAV